MTKQSRSKKDGKGREEEWSWEETPETIEALRQLHASSGKPNKKRR